MILKVYIILITLFPIIPLTVYAENGDTTTFVKIFGGIENDYAYHIQQTSDSGYIIAGQTDSYGNGTPMRPDVWVLKLDILGNKEWEKTFGGKEGDGAFFIQETTDKCYILSGSSSSYGKGYPSIWIIKLNSYGDSLWTRLYEGKVVSIANSIKQTVDGGYIMAGRGNENVIKLDKNGEKQWGKHFGWLFYSVQQTKDSGYIAVGDSIYQQHEWNYIPSLYIIKLDRAGIKEWLNPLGNDFTGRAVSVEQTTDEGYIIAGDSIHIKSQFEQSHYAMVMKLTSDGRPEWKYFGNEYSGAKYVTQTIDGGYIFAGNTLDNEHGLDFLLVKLDENGHEEWIRTYGDVGTWEYASSIQQTFDGGFIVAGQTESYGAGRYDMWILKLDQNGNISIPSKIFYPEFPLKNKSLLEQNHPNPFSSFTTINYKLPHGQMTFLRIYNLLGKEISTLVNEYQSAGSYTMKWNGSSIPSGIYYYRLQTGYYSETRKMVLIK